MKSAPGSTETLSAGERAALRAFTKPQPLPQLRRDAPTTPEEWEGRSVLPEAFLIRLDRIEPDPEQPRRNLDETALSELAASVEALGVMQPITVRWVKESERYRIVSGERRFRAATRAGLTEMPCWVQRPEDRQILLRQVVENWQRADLHPFEIADSLGALRDRWGYNQNEIARFIGKSKGDVSKFLSLLKLPESVKDECRHDPTGMMSRKHLEAIAHAPDGVQETLFRRVKDHKLTVKETDKVVREATAKVTGHKRQGAPVAAIFRFATLKATVTVQVRKSKATPDDLLEALDAARRQVLRSKDTPTTNGDDVLAS